MNKFKILLAMQLKEKLDLSYLKDKKQTLFKVIFAILGFVVVAALAYLILWVCRFLNLFSALQHIPVSVMSVVFGVLFVLGLFSCTISLSKSLYLAKDNQVLITFPVDANMLFLSKMAVHCISEIKKAFGLYVPIFLSYGLISALPLAFYPWMMFMFIVLSIAVVMVSGLLSIPCILIMNFLNKNPILKTILIVGLLGGLTYFVVKVIGLIPSNINLIRSWAKVSIWLRTFLNNFTNTFFIFYAFVLAICGKFENLQTTLFTNYSWIVLLVLVGTILLFAGLNAIVSRPLYLKAISKQFEFKKKQRKPRKNISLEAAVSTVTYEGKKIIRNTSLFSNTLTICVVAPIAVFALNKLYSAINTRLMGDYLTIAFNILIISIFALSHNINVASIYSRDSDSLIISKIFPQSSFKMLLSRLGYNFFTTLFIVCETVPIFLKFSTLTAFEGVLVFITILFLAWSHILWSAEIDFLHPQVRLFRSEGAESNNPNEVKSSILCFAMCLLLFGLTLFFMLKNANYIWIKLAVISTTILVAKFFLFRSKANVLFREVM